MPKELPEPLKEVYRGLGGLIEMDRSDIGSGGRAPFAAQDALVRVRELKFVDGMVEFAWENQ